MVDRDSEGPRNALNARWRLKLAWGIRQRLRLVGMNTECHCVFDSPYVLDRDMGRFGPCRGDPGVDKTDKGY